MKIKSISIQNFKGCKDKTYTFDGKNATVSGANATGKTTILDAFWWLLFNKDSHGNEKFSIRPLDENGNQIDNIEIKVSAVFDNNGREIEFSKVQKQKWVKRRGTDVTELQGNENLYEIDGYPKSEKDYKVAISEIVSEEIFKMITNPTYFPSLKWKEQRDILMRFVSEISDYDLASGSEKFAGLLDELMKAPSTDDIKAKYQKALNEWKKKQSELPVRIDEAEKSRLDIDVAEFELGKKAVLELIKSNKEKQEDISKQLEEYKALSDGILELKFAQGDLERKANAENQEKRRNIRREIDEKTGLLLNIDDGIKRNNRDISSFEDAVQRKTIEKNRLAEQWKKVNAETFDESITICPTCNRPWPDDEIEQLRERFEKSKAERLAKIVADGNNAKVEIEIEKSATENLKKCNEENLAKKENLEQEIEELENQLSEIPSSVDVSQTDEYKELEKQIAEKETVLSQMQNASELRRNLEMESEDLNGKLFEIEKKIALAEKNTEIDDRIEELKSEQKEVAQKVADQEKMLYLLEEFIRFKMDKVSDDINKQFDGINFKLFENQLNGGLKETCELTVNGVLYGSLNNGHRIIAGLQIIKALQGLYGVSMPVFVDNAESISNGNFPEMNCQIIKLNVPSLPRALITLPEEIEEWRNYYKEIRVEVE